MTSDLSSLMVSEPTAMWAFFATTCVVKEDRPMDRGKDRQIKGLWAYSVLNNRVKWKKET